MEDAIAALQRSVPADYTAPSGKFYFTVTSDVRTKCREGLFDLAIEKLGNAGFKAEKVGATFPVNQPKSLV